MGIFSFFNRDSNKSKNIAKDRLKLVLIHDRAMLSSGMLDQMKDEIIEVISKYVDIDKNELNIDIAQNTENNRRTTLVANIPLKPKVASR
ncbi:MULTISPECIES: cell division topological specificity factor MinE [Fusobacterium]|uniref:Cell division topological specificity factor n=1 Tax=Fusobacterium hominis TaxID=2764326 RepID=A0A7G9GXE3_9FUSO|nr:MULTISPECIES: cell division topological specificity factor MinE [Fusobacterium]QNM15475.1 cell division topological specificity factor MinE [Fusobacterium hominis]